MIFVIEVIEVSTPQQEGLRIGMWNVRSMGEKKGAVKNRITDHNFDIFAVVETWFKHGEESNVRLTGYHKPIGLNRTGKKGGGLVLYLKQNINFKVETSAQSMKYIQFQCVKIFEPIRFDLINVYVPPKLKESPLFLLQAFLAFRNRKDNIVILGDFNMSVPDCETELEEINGQFGVEQLIKTATRPKKGKTRILDHIYVSSPPPPNQDMAEKGEKSVSNLSSAPRVLESGVMDKERSDHRAIYCTLKLTSGVASGDASASATVSTSKNVSSQDVETEDFSCKFKKCKGETFPSQTELDNHLLLKHTFCPFCREWVKYAPGGAWAKNHFNDHLKVPITLAVYQEIISG